MFPEEKHAYWSDKCHGCQNCVYATPGYVRADQTLWVDCRVQWDERLEAHPSYLMGHACDKHEYKAQAKEYKHNYGTVDDVLARILGKTSRVDQVLSKILG